MSVGFRKGVASKDLRDQPLVLDGIQILAIPQGDAGALLPPMLDGVEPDVGKGRDIRAGSVHRHDATRFAQVGQAQGGRRLVDGVRV